MQGYRATTAATCLYVPACPAAMKVFEALAKIEQTVQKTVKTLWTEKEYLWKFRISCDLTLWASREKFPSFPYEISDSLLISPKIPNEMKLVTGAYPPFHLTTRFRNLISTAETKKNEGGFREWTVRWTQ